MKTYYFGINWDAYTPAVEGQIIRDVLALKSTCRDEMCAVVPQSEQVAKLMRTLQVKPILAPASLAKLWILYQTTETQIDPPAHAVEIITRKLFQKLSKGGLNTNVRVGYYLPRMDRAGPSSSILTKPAPTNVGFTDPYIIQRWS